MCTLVSDLSNQCVDVAAVQETHFVCEADYRELKNDSVVYSAFGIHLSAGVSLLVGRSLDAIVNVVFAGDGGRLLVADVAVKTFEFRIEGVHVPNATAERRSFLRRLGSFLDAWKRTVLVGDWNAILDSNIDRAGRGASSVARCDSALSDFLTEFELVDRFRLDHPGREMWTGNLPSGQVRSYLDRVLVSRADSDLVACPTFHWLGRSDHKLVRVSLRLANRPSLASYWKFDTSLLEIWDFRKRLENLIQRALVGALIGNKWWVSLKYRIRDFAIKYSQQLALDRAKKAKSLEDRLSRAVEGCGDSVAVDLAKGDFEREASERYKGLVVRNRLTRVPNEAVKCSAFMRKEELRRFPCWYIECVNAPDGRMLRSNLEIREAFRTHYRDCFARCPDLHAQEFRDYLADFPRLGEAEAASCEGAVTECEVRRAMKQVGLNKSPGLDGLPFEVYLRMLHMFAPILTNVINHWLAQGAIPGSITKGVITLLKKGRRHVLGEPELKICPGLGEPFAACHQWSDRPWAELRCEGKIHPRQLALGAPDLRGDKRRHQSHADQFRSVEGLR